MEEGGGILQGVYCMHARVARALALVWGACGGCGVRVGGIGLMYQVLDTGREALALGQG